MDGRGKGVFLGLGGRGLGPDKRHDEDWKRVPEVIATRTLGLLFVFGKLVLIGRKDGKRETRLRRGGVVFKHCVFAKRLALSSPVGGGRTGRDDGSV